MAARPPSRSSRNAKQDRGVLASYMDNNEFSGVTVALGEGKHIDLRKLARPGGICFWGKGGPGSEEHLPGPDGQPAGRHQGPEQIVLSGLWKDRYQLELLPDSR